MPIGINRDSCINPIVATRLFNFAHCGIWRADYNESRPHGALGEKTPNEFAKGIAASRDPLGQQTAENSP